MSEQEKQIISTLIENLHKISNFKKGYVLGFLEGKVIEKEIKEDK